MKIKKIYILIGLLAIHITVKAQDIHFSQFFETPLLRNPALAGIFTGSYRIQMVYRDQWRSVTDGYRTGSLNGEYKWPIGKADDFLTFGGQFLFDRAVTAAFRFGVSETSYVTIQADHSLQDKYQETLAGAMYGMKIGPQTENPDYVLHGGVFLRWNDALIPVIKVDYSGLSFAFSYDVNISRLKPASQSRGGFEFSVSYIGFSKRLDKTTQNSILCPRF